MWLMQPGRICLICILCARLYETIKPNIKCGEMEPKKQVIRGYIIVVDGWAGMHNSLPFPHLLLTPPANTHGISEVRFRTFQLELDGQTNRRMDKDSYRVLCLHD